VPKDNSKFGSEIVKAIGIKTTSKIERKGIFKGVSPILFSWNSHLTLHVHI